MAFTTGSPAFSLFVYVLSLLPDWSYFRTKNIFYVPNVPSTEESYIKYHVSQGPSRQPSVALTVSLTGAISMLVTQKIKAFD